MKHIVLQLMAILPGPKSNSLLRSDFATQTCSLLVVFLDSYYT
jgi:hypothetical protein